MNEDHFVKDLRRAYRLIYSYQRSILNLVEGISNTLGLKFNSWEPTHVDPPSGSATNPAPLWAWDMMPMYDVTFSYNSPNRVAVDSYMLVIGAQADTAFEKCCDSLETDCEPSLDDLESLEKSNSRIYFWYVVVEEVLGRTSWANIYASEWPDERSFKFKAAGARFRGGFLEFGLDAFLDQDAAENTINAFLAEAKIEVGTT